MTTVSNDYLNRYDDYYLENSINFTEYLSNKKRNYSLDMTELNIIEYIDDNKQQDYIVNEHEQKYKIFDNISSVIKNKDNNIELVINVPKTGDILSINKIKLSKNIKKYINTIFISLDNNKIVSQNEIYNKKFNFNKLRNINNLMMNIIDCSKGEVNIHIILEPNSINEIINNYIYIVFSYINFKNKVKFMIEKEY
jgi:hypothetical protein